MLFEANETCIQFDTQKVFKKKKKIMHWSLLALWNISSQMTFDEWKKGNRIILNNFVNRVHGIGCHTVGCNLHQIMSDHTYNHILMKF